MEVGLFPLNKHGDFNSILRDRQGVFRGRTFMSYVVSGGKSEKNSAFDFIGGFQPPR